MPTELTQRCELLPRSQLPHASGDSQIRAAPARISVSQVRDLGPARTLSRRGRPATAYHATRTLGFRRNDPSRDRRFSVLGDRCRDDGALRSMLGPCRSRAPGHRAFLARGDTAPVDLLPNRGFRRVFWTRTSRLRPARGPNRGALPTRRNSIDREFSIRDENDRAGERSAVSPRSEAAITSSFGALTSLGLNSSCQRTRSCAQVRHDVGHARDEGFRCATASCSNTSITRPSQRWVGVSASIVAEPHREPSRR